MPRPRLTTRRLMLAVAILALALAGKARLDRRSAWCMAQADRHLDEWLGYAGEGTEEAERLAAYHLDMTTRYRRAARPPWMTMGIRP